MVGAVVGGLQDNPTETINVTLGSLYDAGEREENCVWDFNTKWIPARRLIPNAPTTTSNAAYA